MQIFIIKDPLFTAKVLDKRRFYSQIREARIVLKWCQLVQSGQDMKWKNQPLVNMYINHIEWLKHYINVFESLRYGNEEEALIENNAANRLTPPFHNTWFFTEMKKRLYTKNKSFYNTWNDLGESNTNWYFVNGEWKGYRQV